MTEVICTALTGFCAIVCAAIASQASKREKREKEEQERFYPKNRLGSEAYHLLC